MRHHLPMALLVLTSAFGCGKSSKKADPSPVATTTPPSDTRQDHPQSTMSLYYEKSSDLPPCDGSYQNALAFILDEKAFKACIDGAWIAVDVGGQTDPLLKVTAEPSGTNCPSGGKAVQTGLDANGNNTLESDEVTNTQYLCDSKDPFKIKQTYYAIGDGTNICTEYESIGEDCYLLGAKVEVFENRNWQVTLAFNHRSFMNDGAGDTDSDVADVSLSFIQDDGDTNGSVKVLDKLVMRTGSVGGYLWAYIDEEKSAVYLIHDTDGDFEIDGTDELVATYPLSL